VEAIRQEADEVREVLRRAVVFRRQLDASAGRPFVPLLVLPEAPSFRFGACISCGVQTERWRCPFCLAAVYLALGDVERLGEVAESADTP
jgi:hypothetical protein